MVIYLRSLCSFLFFLIQGGSPRSVNGAELRGGCGGGGDQACQIIEATPAYLCVALRAGARLRIAQDPQGGLGKKPSNPIRVNLEVWGGPIGVSILYKHHPQIRRLHGLISK